MKSTKKKQRKTKKNIFSEMGKKLKIKKFSSTISEKNEEGGLFGMLWDEANKKAMRQHMGISKKYEDKIYTISVDEPFVLSIKDYDDFHKMKMLLRRYKVPFTEKEEMKKTTITEN